METMWKTFNDAGLADLIIAEYGGEALTAWIVFSFENVLYYPYGASDEKYRNLQPSALVGWEAIKLGKKLGCEMFDMWGAAEDLNDTSDPYYGFTNFKAKFGGKHVTYIDSYDMILNKPMYAIFNAANRVRWGLLNILR